MEDQGSEAPSQPSKDDTEMIKDEGSNAPSQPSKDDTEMIKDQGSNAPSQPSKEDLFGSGLSGCTTSDEMLQDAVSDHQNALDDLVKVNSHFSAAVFVGLAMASGEQQNIGGYKQCEAGVHVATRLVRSEVISFAFYLFSSLVAKSLKTHLFTYLIPPTDNNNIHGWRSMVLRGSLFTLSTSTSIIGYVLLLYSMIDIIQLRLGKVTCKGIETLNAVGVLIGVNIFALLIYVPFVGHAIVKFTTIFDNLCPRCPTCNHLIRDNPVFCPTCQHPLHIQSSTSQNP